MKYGIVLLCTCLLFSAFGQNKALVDGYASKMSGEVLRYFSPLHEFADSSLLTRCNGISPIEMNAQLPTGKSKTTQFRFLIGHSSGTSTGNRHFNISLNGKSLFTLNTQMKRSGMFVEEKQIDPKISYRLSCIEYDINQDVFAWLYISVPTSMVKNQAVFKFTGEDEQSRDWLMIFMQQSAWKFQLEASNLILKNAKLRELNLRVLNPLDHDSMVVSVSSRFFQKDFTVQPGYNNVSFAGYPMEFLGTDTVTISVGQQQFQQVIPLQATKNYQFHIIHHSHNDIGYSHLQTEVERIQTKNIIDALSWISNNEAIGEKAVWHIESLWAVENFLRNADEPQIQSFVQAVKSGNIVLSANYANVLTGLSQREELNWLVEYAKQLEKKYDILVSNAMITDIPGITHAGLENYTRNNIPYLSLGPNYVEHLPDHGDRVGGVIKENGDQVFYWKAAPEAKEKLLVWTAGKGYSYFHNIQDNEKEAKWESRISAYVHQLESTHYPYDIVQLRYTKNADNGPVDTRLGQFVKAWNERYASPTLIVSNVDTLFALFEEKYGDQIPVLTGEISPYWEDGAYSTAVEEMENRALSQQTIAMETYARKTSQWDTYSKDFYALHRNIILFHEHTWGSWCSISDPTLFFTTEQWRIKKSFLDSAHQQYNRLSKHLGFNYVPKDAARTVSKSIISDFQVDLTTGGIAHVIVENMDIVGRENPYDLMEMVYSKGISPMEFSRSKTIKILHQEDSKDQKSIELSMELEGVKNMTIKYLWIKNTNRISCHVSFDKMETFEKESMHMAFPFQTSDWKLAYGDEESMLNYPQDQLPGSNKEFICVSQQVELTNDSRKISIQAPAFSLYEVGAIIDETKVNGAKVWNREAAPTNPLFLYLLNNYWHTNYKASQGGHFSFDVQLDIE